MSYFKSVPKSPKAGDTYNDNGRDFTVTKTHENGTYESMLTDLHKQAEAKRKEENAAADAMANEAEQLRRDVDQLTAQLAEVTAERDKLKAELEE